MASSKSVLVTGGAGYVGAHVCKALAGRGYSPVTLDTMERGDPERLRWGPLVVGDAGDKALVAQTVRQHGCSAVVHVAAYAFVGESVQFPSRYYRNNLVVPLEAFDAAAEAGARAFVFSSTCSVYGDPGAEPVGEEAPLLPVSPYGTAKVIAEQELARAAARAGLPLVSLRLFNAIGGSPDLEIGESEYQRYGRLIPDALKAAASSAELTLNGNDHDTFDGTPVRDYVHVEDLAEGHALAVEHALAGRSLTCNLSTGSGHSVKQVIAAVQEVTGRALEISWRGKRAGDPATILGDPRRARDVLGWRPRWSLLQGIQHAWRWRSSRAASGG